MPGMGARRKRWLVAGHGADHPIPTHVIPIRRLVFACEFGPSTALGNHAIVLMIGQPRGSGYRGPYERSGTGAGARLIRWLLGRFVCDASACATSLAVARVVR